MSLCRCFERSYVHPTAETSFREPGVGRGVSFVHQDLGSLLTSGGSMRLATYALILGLSLALAVSSHATNTPLPVSETSTSSQVPLFEVPELLAPEEKAFASTEPKAEIVTALEPPEGCPGDSAPFVVLEWQQETLASRSPTCGDCSASGCRGANIGQACWLGFWAGWGRCDYFSGPLLCSTGGIKCSCGVGAPP